MFDVIPVATASDFYAAADRPWLKLARCFRSPGGRATSRQQRQAGSKANWSGYLRYRVGDWRRDLLRRRPLLTA